MDPKPGAGHYENVGDLSLSLITGVLTNKALRSRLGDAREEVQEDVALRDAVMEEAARVDKERVRVAEQLREVTEQADRQRIDAEEERIRAQAAERALQASLEETKAAQRKERESMEEEVTRVRDHEDELSGEVGRLRNELERQSSMRRFRTTAALLVPPLAAVGWLLFMLLGSMELPVWVRGAIAVAVPLGAWMYLTPVLSRSEYVRETRLGRLLTWSGSAVIRLVWVLGLGVVSGLLVDVILNL